MKTTNTNSFVVIGDTHGNHRLISHRVKALQLTDMTLLHVGDFGIGFKDESEERADLRKLDNVLVEKNCQLYVIRGNHDNPSYFDGKWSDTFKNIHMVPDYTIVNINGDDVLMAGGAISVDRGPRKKDMLLYARQGIHKELYWYDEAFILDEEKLKEIKGVRYVVTHTCPGFCSPVNSFANEHMSHGGLVEHFVIEGDDKLKDDCNKERNDLTKMYEILKENNFIQKWFYGHFHCSNAEYHDETDFVTVNIDQFYEVRQ